MNKAFIENNYLIIINIWKSRYLLVTLPFVFLVLFNVFYDFLPEKYEVSSRLLIQDTEELNPLLSDLSIESIQRKTFYYEDLIKSDKVLNDALKNIYNETNEKTELESLKKQIRESIELKRTSYNKNDQNVFDIKIKWHNKKDIVYLLKKIDESFINAFNEKNISALNKSLVFVGSQLNEKKLEILESERKIIDFKVKNKEIASNLNAFDFQTDLDLDDKIMNREINYLGVKEKINVLKKQLLRDNPKKKDLELKIERLKIELRNYRLKYTEEHSLVKETKKIIESLESQLLIISKRSDFTIEEMKKFILENKELISYSLVLKNNELEDLEIERLKLEKELLGLREMKTNLQEKSKNHTEVYLALRDLEQDLKVRKDQYDKLLDKEEFIKLTKEIKRFEKDDTVTSMNVNTLNVKSLKYPRIVYLILGFIFGFLLVISSSVLSFLVNTSLIKTKDIEETLEAEVISRVSKLDNIKK